MEMLTVQQVAEQLEISPRRVRALILEGRLKATRMGNSVRGALYLIHPDDFEMLVIRPAPGRPPRSEER